MRIKIKKIKKKYARNAAEWVTVAIAGSKHVRFKLHSTTPQNDPLPWSIIVIIKISLNYHSPVFAVLWSFEITSYPGTIAIINVMWSIKLVQYFNTRWSVREVLIGG